LSKWRQNRDGSITGLISGAKAYGEGETITTSAITSNAEDGAVVQTKSGSRYYLEPKAVAGGLFGIGAPPMTKAAGNINDAAAKRKEAAAAAAAARKQEAEEKRKQAAAAAEEKRREAEERKKEAIAAAVAKRKEAEEKRKAQSVANQAKKEESTTSSQTFSLGFLNFGQDSSSATTSSVAGAPKGVPVLSKWRQNGDGSISGTISGSSAFEGGEFITTSPVPKNAVGGSVVRTASGSRYYLEPIPGRAGPKPSNDAAEARRLAAEEKKQKLAAAAEEKRQQAAAAAEARRLAAEEKKQASLQSIETAQPSSTISLGFFNFGNQAENDDTTSKPPPSSPTQTIAKKLPNAPRGVPTLYQWRQNRNGSISGFIAGSKSFKEGESITTSPITSSAIERTVVQTKSGSRYYLAPKGEKIASPAAAKQPQRTVKKAPPKVKSQPTKPLQKQAKTTAKATAPRGVPSLVKWKRNGDSSITGFISGSPRFKEGEKITTSPITRGKIGSGEVVKTGSGSSYFLV